MDIEKKIQRLSDFKNAVDRYSDTHEPKLRSFINQESTWVKREVLEAGCYRTITISPPPAIGGLVMKGVDPFGMMFQSPYGANLYNLVTDMIDRTIGVLRSLGDKEEKLSVPPSTPSVEVDSNIQKGYAFVAMPMNPNDHQLVDVREAIKEAAAKCGIHAECVDEAESNERITDRILESIGKAEFVIADLTNSRPNVFFEAGYAHGLRKVPVYIARVGTRLEFDLQDYPVIFFNNMRELKDGLEKRLRGLAEKKAKK